MLRPGLGTLMRDLRRSPAIVVAAVALFVALGSTSYAVLRIPAKSVGTAQLKAKAVTTAKLRNGAVDRAKLSNGAVGGAKVEPGSLRAVHFAPEELPAATTSASAEENRIGGAGEPIALGHHTTVLSLDDPEGTGAITVAGPARLSVHATATVHNTGSFGVVECRVALFEQPGGGQLPLGQAGLESVGNQAITTIPTAGAIEVAAGTFDVELQCVTFQETDGHFDYLKGNLVAVASPR